MSQNQEKIIFPAKHPLKEMDKLLEGETVRQLQVRTKKEVVLVNLPVEFTPRDFIPRIFNAPTKAVGVGISTIARLLGVRVVVDYTEGIRRSR